MCDVIVQATGSLESGMQFCRDNNLSITMVPDAGIVYAVSDAVVALQDNSILQQFSQNGVTVGTLDATITPPPPHVYSRVLTIDHTQCGHADSVYFPVLVSVSDTSLKTIGNGGHVCSGDGSDILFFKDAGEVSKLNWEIELYDGTAGILIAWVLLPIVSCTTDTNFYMQYGDPGISSFEGGSAGSVWNSNYIAVYHLGSTLTADATAHGQDLNNVNSVTKVTGKIGDGAHFSSALFQSLLRDYVPGLPQGPAERSMTCWFQMAANQSQEFFGYGDNRGLGYYSRFAFYYTGSNVLCVEVSGASSSFPWVYDTNWHKMTAVLPAGATDLNQVLIYFDGVLQTVTMSPSSAILLTSNEQLALGQIPTYYLDTFFSGTLDEVRIMDKGISADWEITEYNNQNNPGDIGASGFITYGSEY